MIPEFDLIWNSTLGWQPDSICQQQWQKLYEAILLGNRQLNLTRITEAEDFWEKHLWDSLAGIKWFNLTIEAEKSLRVIDVGSGAGFPGIPLAIACSNWQVTLLDATRKKVNFLENLIAQLSLKNVTALNGRAEEIGKEKSYREKYDLALIRAVASASVCAEYTLPMVKVGGYAILYRGNWTEEETNLLQGAVAKLGGEIAAIEELHTPISNSIRHWIYLRKITPTSSQYPRRIGIPNQQPLQ